MLYVCSYMHTYVRTHVNMDIHPTLTSISALTGSGCAASRGVKSDQECPHSRNFGMSASPDRLHRPVGCQPDKIVLS